MLIGDRVKKARIAKNMSQQALGDLLGVSKVSVCGYERGTRTPNLETFLTLIDVLELNPSYALGYDQLVVREEEEPYQVHVATVDLEILNEIKQHRELYNKICVNPHREIEKYQQWRIK